MEINDFQTSVGILITAEIAISCIKFIVRWILKNNIMKSAKNATESVMTTNVINSVASILSLLVLFWVASQRFPAGVPLSGDNVPDLLALGLFGSFIISSIAIKLNKKFGG